jgi:hypothetical protein
VNNPPSVPPPSTMTVTRTSPSPPKPETTGSKAVDVVSPVAAMTIGAALVFTHNLTGHEWLGLVAFTLVHQSIPASTVRRILGGIGVSCILGIALWHALGH